MLNELSNKLIEMLEDIEELKKQVDDLKREQQKILDYLESSKKMRMFLLNNWWKITAVTLPLLFILGEIAIYVRKVL